MAKARSGRAGTGDARIPRPVPDGTEQFESLGRFLDNLFGDARMRRKVQPELEALYLPDEDAPVDPEPVELPEPVSGGTEHVTTGVRRP